MSVFYPKVGFLLIFTALLSACQTPADDEHSLRAQVSAREEAALLDNFQQNVVKTRDQQQQSAHSSTLAQQLARLPAPELQKILISQPDSALAIKIDTNLIRPILVENAAMLMAVRSYEETRKKIFSLVTQLDGFIASEGEKYSETKIENTLELQIPAAQFTNAINQLRDLAMILREKQTWKDDLTVNWAEIQTRLEAKRAAETRLKELLKAGRGGEVLPIQRELDLLYEDIQTLNRSAKIIRDKGIYSQIKVCFYQELNRPTEAQASFSEKFGNNLQNGWANFKNMLIVAASYWILITAAFVLLIIYWLARRSSQKQTLAHQQQLWQQQQQWLQKQDRNKN